MRIPCFKYTLFLAALSFAAPSISAQESDLSCDGFVGTVGGLSTSPDVSRPFILESLASEALRAHEACAATPQRTFTVYALNQAVFALDRLERYAQADSLVDVYFQRYADHPAYQDTGRDTFFGEYRARFARWRSLFAMLRGDFLTAAHTNGQAEALVTVLPLSRQIHLRLDLAYLYEQDERHSQALAIIDSIQADHGARLQADATLHTTYARVLLAGGELLGKQGRSDATSTLTPEQIGLLEEAERRLEQSIGMYDRAVERGRQAEAVVVLGDVRSTLRNAPDYLSSALDSARAWGADRSVVYGLWRRGRHYLRDGVPRMAEIDFIEARALSDSIGLGEFDRYLALDLGRAYEDQGKFDQARAAFEEAHQWSEGRLGARWREQAQGHLREIDRRENRTDRLWLYAIIALFTLSLFFNLYQYLQRRRVRTADPTPAAAAPTDAFTRRYAFAAEVLTRPQTVGAEIDDPILAGYLRKGGVTNQGELCEAVAALEKARGFGDVEGSAIRKTLDRGFKRRRWAWPKSMDEWRRHVERHAPNRPWIPLEMPKYEAR